MQTIDFSPFYRSTVGFDRLFNRLDGLVGQEAKTYPPYNIEKVGDNAYRISIAVAGFSNGDIAIESKENAPHHQGCQARREPTRRPVNSSTAALPSAPSSCASSWPSMSRSPALRSRTVFCISS